jgi:hypothetical protein
MKKGRNNQKGQTAIEYVLMLLVISSIVSSLLVYVKKRYLGDATRCEAPANRKLFLCRINALVGTVNYGGNKRFQYFPFKK